jgi:hypothetical protein
LFEQLRHSEELLKRYNLPHPSQVELLKVTNF